MKKEASLVQLVERWSPKPNVEGSSPSGRVYMLKIINFNTFLVFMTIDFYT